MCSAEHINTSGDTGSKAWGSERPMSIDNLLCVEKDQNWVMEAGSQGREGGRKGAGGWYLGRMTRDSVAGNRDS